MKFTDKQVIDRLTTAAQLAEATFMKIKPEKLEERIIVIDAIEELGKALAVAQFRKLALALVMAPIFFSMVGCRGLNRLLNGPDNDEKKMSPVISSTPEIGAAPEFNVETPAGYERVVFHGELINPAVAVRADATSLVRVFIKERNLGQWFALHTGFSEAFWYTFDPVAGIVTYQGQNLSLKEYCVYQYVKI